MKNEEQESDKSNTLNIVNTLRRPYINNKTTKLKKKKERQLDYFWNGITTRRLN